MTLHGTTPVWVVRPQQRPLKLHCVLTKLGEETWAEPCRDHRALLLDYDAFLQREDAVAKTKELLAQEVATLRKRLAKLERLELS